MLLTCLFATALASVPVMAAAEAAPDAAAPEPAPAKPRPAHPEPRVIVNVLSVRGPHERAAVERSARFGWGKIVGCYKAVGRGSRGALVLELTVSGSGKVAGSKRKHSTFKPPELAPCLAKAMRRVPMPRARAGSTAIVEIQLAPGDPS